MTDSTTALAPAAERVLDAGERYLAGLAAHPLSEGRADPDGAIVRTGVGGLVMGELIDSYRGDTGPAGEEAGAVPRGYHVWVALTSRRLLFFEGGMLARLGSRLAPEGTPGALCSSLELSEVLACEPADVEGEERLELRFADGLHAQLIPAHPGEGGEFRLAFAAVKQTG